MTGPTDDVILGNWVRHLDLVLSRRRRVVMCLDFSLFFPFRKRSLSTLHRFHWLLYSTHTHEKKIKRFRPRCDWVGRDLFRVACRRCVTTLELFTARHKHAGVWFYRVIENSVKDRHSRHDSRRPIEPLGNDGNGNPSDPTTLRAGGGESSSASHRSRR